MDPGLTLPVHSPLSTLLALFFTSSKHRVTFTLSRPHLLRLAREHPCGDAEPTPSPPLKLQGKGWKEGKISSPGPVLPGDIGAEISRWEVSSITGVHQPCPLLNLKLDSQPPPCGNTSILPSRGWSSPARQTLPSPTPALGCRHQALTSSCPMAVPFRRLGWSVLCSLTSLGCSCLELVQVLLPVHAYTPGDLAGLSAQTHVCLSPPRSGEDFCPDPQTWVSRHPPASTRCCFYLQQGLQANSSHSLLPLRGMPAPASKSPVWKYRDSPWCLIPHPTLRKPHCLCFLNIPGTSSSHPNSHLDS